MTGTEYIILAIIFGSSCMVLYWIACGLLRMHQPDYKIVTDVSFLIDDNNEFVTYIVFKDNSYIAINPDINDEEFKKVIKIAHNNINEDAQ